jgi:hypothetical protein
MDPVYRLYTFDVASQECWMIETCEVRATSREVAREIVRDIYRPVFNDAEVRFVSQRADALRISPDAIVGR